MLQELSIRNFAIIPALNVTFDEGMTVLTGETGAGKSIIIDAVGLLAGGRGSNEYIRQGEKKCVLEGLFAMDQHPLVEKRLDSLSIEHEDNMLVLQREIYRNGKNTCRINGHLVNLTTLRSIGELLVDIHGQNEHQELMQASKHVELLDEYGKEKIGSAKVAYQKVFQQYHELRSKMEKKEKNEKEFAQRMDMLRFQVEEIEAAQLEVGEEERLLEERNKLVNYQKIAESLKVGYDALQGEEASSSLDRIGFAMDAMLSIEAIDREYQAIAEAIQNGYFILQEAAADLSRQLDSLEMDEGRLEVVESRLDSIRQLKRKYGDSEQAIIEYYKEITLELSESLSFENQSTQLEKELKEKEDKLIQFGDSLSELRVKEAKKLEADIMKQLKELYLEKAIFQVKIVAHGEGLKAYRENGKDEIEFYLTTNPGEPLKPLVKVASGGELSRIMLAMKTILSQTQGMTSIIFDEVDTGVSGRIAQSIAEKIHQVAQHSQVLCITHLPQVAAIADAQYFIKKEIVADRTKTSVEILSLEQRVQEIARMLAGTQITPLTVEHAKELLQLAGK
ncbi:DNA repair protein RecN [Vagococcus entomophilus]|uniref:DNA repair protein RecN n=1 Tax=Vagococcus entomophilus TaxID=1160095 RepID=A0A430AIA8_9ENTE|nr:DNA repair protein RecN [Vagococcus entomophilus]RSU07820.1 DNA repair protein RecN [Vagococcus entomophilus]